MLTDLFAKIMRLPKLLLGFVVIVLTLVVLLYQDPPKTVCGVQMEALTKQLEKGFFRTSTRGLYQSKFHDAFDLCLASNSPGGCLEVFQRFDHLEKRVRNISDSCGGDPATVPVRNMIKKGVELFVKIGWGEKPPINQYQKTGWLDTDDLGVYCRLQQQYLRLFGAESWKALMWSLVPSLPEADTLSKREMMKKSLFTYPCSGLY